MTRTIPTRPDPEPSQRRPLLWTRLACLAAFLMLLGLVDGARELGQRAGLALQPSLGVARGLSVAPIPADPTSFVTRGAGRLEWALRSPRGLQRLSAQVSGRHGTARLFVVERGGERLVAEVEPAEAGGPAKVQVTFVTKEPTWVLVFEIEPSERAASWLWRRPQLWPASPGPGLLLLSGLLLTALAVGCRRFAPRRLLRLQPLFVLYLTAATAAGAELAYAAWPQLLPPAARGRLQEDPIGDWMAPRVLDEDLGWRYRPSTRWHVRDDLRRFQPDPRQRPYMGPTPFDLTFATDAQGFRNAEVPDRAAIVLLGDSFADGTWTRREAQWSQRLAARSGREVLNLATSGYGPQQYARVFERYGARLEPRDVVVGLYEGNDLDDALAFSGWLAFEGTWPEYLRAHLGQPEPRGHRSRLVAALHELWARTRAPAAAVLEAAPDPVNPLRGPHGWFHAWPSLLAGACRSREAWAQHPGLPLTLDAMRRLERRCQAVNARLWVVLIPTRESFEPLADLGRLAPATRGSYLLHRTALTALLAQRLAQEGIRTIPLRPAFERAYKAGDALYHPFDLHWNDRGQDLAARVVAERITPR